MRMREIAQARVRYEYRKIRVPLPPEGWGVGKSRMQVAGAFNKLPGALGAMGIVAVAKQYARIHQFLVQMPEKADDLTGTDLGGKTH